MGIICALFVGFVLVSLWCMFKVAHMADEVVYIKEDEED